MRRAIAELLIVFAHMTGAFFTPAHFKDSNALRAQFADPAGPFAGSPAPDSDEELSEALNEAIRTRSLLALLPDPIRSDGEASVARGQALCRDLIDGWLAGFAEPGNRIELFDGLHEPGQFADAIAPGYFGEIDLATCVSTVIAAVIEMRTGSRIRISSRHMLTVPYPEFEATREALRLLAQSGGSYLHVRAQVARNV